MIDKIKVIVDAPSGAAGLINNNNPSKNFFIGFKTIDGLGQPFFVFGKKEENMMYDNIIYEYSLLHPNLTPQESDEVKMKMRKNISDLSIYNILSKYDSMNRFDRNSESTEFASSYIEAMLKPVLQESRRIIRGF